VVAMLAGAAVGAAMIGHLHRPLVWTLVAAAGCAVGATALWSLHPSSLRRRVGVAEAAGH
jgi:hypothetical protein